MKNLSTTLISTLLLSGSLLASNIGESVKENSLIVYNGGIGLVHEKRSLSLKKNENSILYKDVARSIDIDSVSVKLPDDIQLYSQQYRFDKLTQTKLLNAHVGKAVEVKVLKDTKNFKIIKATLLSAEGSSCLIKTASKKIISVNAQNIIFKTIPHELITKPSLVWNVKTKQNVDSNIELDYLIKNISWKSDYILNINKNSAQLIGWISIDNRSGKRYEQTQLSVLAGEINSAHRPQPTMYRKALMMSAEAAPVKNTAHEGYHIYKIPFKVTLANNEKTQIKFISLNNLKINRSYSTHLQNPLYQRAQSNHNVTQYINIKALKTQLPKGIIRSYSQLQNQKILLGQTFINHTAKKTPIKLKIGTNFDTKVSAKLLNRDDTKYRFNSTLEYKVQNSSEETKIVELLIPFTLNSHSSVKSSMSFHKKQGNLISFSVKIAPESSKKFSVTFVSKK